MIRQRRQIHFRIGIGAIAVSAALVISGCASGAAEPAATETQAAGGVDQELHDMLPEQIRESGVVRVAGAFDNPPNLYADTSDTNKALGVFPDIAAAVGEILGVDFEFVNTQWPGQLPGLDSGTFDAIWGQATVTAEREQEIADMVPTSQNGLGWLVPAGNPKNFDGWESACGMRIGITVGAIFGQMLADVSEDICTSQGREAIQVLEFQGAEHQAILSDNIDAGIDGYRVLKGAADAHPDEFSAVEIPREESFEYYSGLAGFATNKKNPGLATAFAAALQQLNESGRLQEIFDENDASITMPEADRLVVNFLSGTPAGEIAN